MNSSKREQIRQILRGLADAHSATIVLMEKALVLMGEELELDPWEFWKSKGQDPPQNAGALVIDRQLFSVSHRDRSCFLGDTLPFRLLDRLARPPKVYVSHNDLLSDVWNDPRTDDAIRSVVKQLRNKLRR